MKRLLWLAFAWVLCFPAYAEQDRERKLSPAQEEQLARDKIIVTQRTWRQIFSPYIFSNEPVFITTDSVLNAWHVLYEETFVAMEERAALRIRPALEGVLEDLRERPAEAPEPLRDRALRRAQIVIGTAARLAGSGWSGGEEIDALISEQARLVEAADAVALPEWLPPGYGMAAIDYRVFKPTGFYTRSPRLQRYFRSLRWLQTMPFRARLDEEMEAMEMIAKAVLREGSLPALARMYRSLGGNAADADVITVREFSDSLPLGEAETWRGQNSGETARMVALSAVSLPDAELFLKTTNATRALPDSLEVAAWLGSPLAAELVRRTAGDQVMEIITTHPRDAHPGGTIYHHYLECAEKLLAPAEPDAPAFMRSLPWRRKSLNTAMAGWAQLRHTWALQARMNAAYLSGGFPFPGFVEPNPPFYQALGDLILRCVREFDELNALEFSAAGLPEDAAVLIPRLEKEADGLRKRQEPIVAKLISGALLDDDDHKESDEAGRLDEELCEALKPFVEVVDSIIASYPGPRVTGVYDIDSVLSGLREVAEGRKTDELIRSHRESGAGILRDRWLNLLDVCRQLESLAHRQLRNMDQTDQEKRFITDYGTRLGGIMFYDGNSYHNPRDDAPRVAAVFNQPGVKFLLAGTGRPREIRVLYPWKGMEVNCRGAILPFHEVPSDQPLTDAEWIDRLGATDAPTLPAWLEPLLAPDAAAGKEQ